METEYELEMRKHLSKGHSPIGISAECIRSHYVKTINSIPECHIAEKIGPELTDLQRRGEMLEHAKDDYLKRNANLIAKAKEEKFLKEIEEAGILDINDGHPCPIRRNIKMMRR